jgi:hypothetical protein
VTGRRPRSRRSPRWRLLGVALLAAVLTTACGLSPPDGVRIDRHVVGPLDDEPDVRRLPPGPSAGEGPEQVVRGFLGAAAATPDPGHALARSFLTAGARWDDTAGAVVYDPTTLTLRPLPPGAGAGPTADVAFRLQAEQVATLARDGAYLPAKGQLDTIVRVGRVGRDWRVRNPPPGLLLTPRDLSRGYRPVLRYLLAPGADVLVPDPVYLSGTRTTLPGAAVRALLAGPGEWLSPAVRTLTPLGSVVVTDGIAVVDLDRAAFDVPNDVRPLLVGQLSATMATVAGVDGVRVLAEGRPYQDRETGPATVPTGLRPVQDGPTYALSPSGGLMQVQVPAPGEPPAGVVGVPGTPGHLVSAVADPSGSGGVAAVQFTAAGLRLLVGPADDLRPAPVPPGALVGPSWLPGSGVVIVAPGPRLLLVPPAGAARTMASPLLGLLGVPREVAVSPDGSRLLLRTGPADPDHPAHGERTELYLARIAVRDGAPVAEGWTPVETGVDAVASPAWTSATEFVVTGRRAGSARGLWRVPIDRLADPERVPLRNLPSAPSVVTAAIGRPLLAVADGRLWRLDGDGWTDLAPARSVAQPH